MFMNRGIEHLSLHTVYSYTLYGNINRFCVIHNIITSLSNVFHRIYTIPNARHISISVAGVIRDTHTERERRIDTYVYKIYSLASPMIDKIKVFSSA